MPKRSAVAVLTTASALVAAALAAPTAGAAPSAQPLPNSVPAWTHSAQSLGGASSASVVNARVYLAPRGGFDKLQQTVMAVSTPGSGQYHHFLTAAQYHASYDPTGSTVASVKSWLTGNGLRVSGVAAYNDFLTVHGTVSAAEKAFSTSIGRFAKSGHVYQAPTSALHVPAGLAGSVLTVTGLDTAPAYAKPLSSADEVPAGFRNARPCSKYYGQVTAKFRADFKTRLPKFAGQYLPYAVCGYTGPFFRAAYEGNLGVYGAGATVGIVDAYGASTIKFDANHYAVRNGDGSYAPGQYTQMLARPWRGLDVCQSPGSWAGEQTLDVEAVHAMAPAAKIVYSGARSCLNSDLRDAVARLVNQDHVQIISNSYGGAEYGESTGDIRAQEKVLLQAAMEGISVLVSSGDNGDELAATGTVQADYFASDPYATAVGGTSTAINWNGSLLFQTGWGTHKYSLSADGKSWNALGFLYGAGGGASSLFNRPSYQNGVVNSPYRMVPDVAMDADPTTGMLVGETQQFPGGVRYDEYRIGGTSLASPLFAGLTALAVGARGGKGAGFLNPLVYHHQNAFYDVKGASPDPGNVRVDYANSVNAKDGLVYSVRTFNHDSSLSVNSGYDDVTGVGVPKPNWAVVVASS